MTNIAAPTPRASLCTAARRLRGQSIIGLLVVMAILAILAAVIYPKYMGRNEYNAAGGVQGQATPIDSANDAVCTEYMSQVAQATTMYRQANNAPPPDLKALKPYGITDEIANTPNCNFGIPKDASQPQTATSAAPAAATPQVSWQQNGQQQQAQPSQQQPAQDPEAAGVNAASQAARNGIPASGMQ